MKFKFGKFEIELDEVGLFVVSIVSMAIVGIIASTLIEIFGK